MAEEGEGGEGAGEKETTNGKEIPITLGKSRLVLFSFIFLPVFVLPCLLLRPLLSVSSAFSCRSGTRCSRATATRCTHVPGSFYRFLWFAWQSRGGVAAGIAFPLHQHATQNSLAYRRNRVAFSRLTCHVYVYVHATNTTESAGSLVLSVPPPPRMSIFARFSHVPVHKSVKNCWSAETGDFRSNW